MAIDLLAETAGRVVDEPARLLEKSGALLYGDFKLASGKRSPYYFDSKKLTLEPQGALFVAQRIVEKLDELEIRYVGGTAYGAIPIVSHVVLFSGLREGEPIRAFYHRRKSDVKKHGTEAQAEGQFPPEGEEIAILEDVVTTGESLLYAIKKAEEEGFNVTHAMTLVDRDEGGRESVEAAGYKFWSLFTVERTDAGVKLVCDVESKQQ
jgi:orotate phosphoribosyltransferase